MVRAGVAAASAAKAKRDSRDGGEGGRKGMQGVLSLARKSRNSGRNSGPQTFSDPNDPMAVFTELEASIKESKSVDSLKVGKRDKHWLVDSKPFVAIIYSAILLNALQMGLQVDLKGKPWDDIFGKMEWCFNILFTVELILKQIFLGPCVYFRDGWNLVDFFLVTSAWVGVIVNETTGGGSSIGIIKMIRLLRIMRMVRLLKVFRTLWMIIKGILDSFKTIFWVSMLLVLILYVSAILTVQTIGDAGTDLYPSRSNKTADILATEEVAEFNNFVYFGSLPRAMFTLFNLAILAEWPEFGRAIWEQQPEMLIFLLAFIVFTTFGVMNVVVGIIVENTLDAARAIHQEKQAEVRRRKLRFLNEVGDLVFALDTDGSGSISIEEMMKGWGSSKVQELITQVNLPHGFTCQEFMQLLDNDADGEITKDEFGVGLFRLIDNDRFQQDCLVHAQLNEVKREMKGLSKSTSDDFEDIVGRLKRVQEDLRQAGLV